MALNFSKLAAAHEGQNQAKAVGPSTPYQLPLDAIDEDPHQPRKEFGEEALADLIASVKERGIKSPISVRKNPDQSERWIINHGARRYRAAKASGLQTIPAFIDDQHNDYDQVIENLHRENLTPMELALFIESKVANGTKKKDIAKMLGVKDSVITFHNALIKPPAFIEVLYRDGKCTAIQALYQLRTLHKTYPEATEAWADNQDDITYASVMGFADELKRPISDAPSMDSRDQFAPATKPIDDYVVEQSGSPKFDTSDDASSKEASSKEDESDYSDDYIGKVEKTGKLKKPKLYISFSGNAATLDLSKRPSQVGLFWVIPEDGSEPFECDGSLIQLTNLSEG